MHKGWVYFEIRRGVMDYHNQGYWQTDNLERDYKKRVITKQELHQAYGDINGDQYNFV